MKPNHERRTINELAMRYKLEPELKDIYVEGVFDQDILRNGLSSVGINGRVVYEIDVVDIPEILLNKHGLSDGNKQRVLVLARELANTKPCAAYKCLVDRDLDHYLGNLETTDGLVWTLYTSLELYFFESELIELILVTTAKARISDFQQYLSSLSRILRELYILRLADHELGLSLKWLSFNRLVTKDDSCLQFDSEVYKHRLLDKNSKRNRETEFNISFTNWEAKLAPDVRLSSRGHDFINLLAHSVRLFGGIKEYSSPAAIERLLVLLADKSPNLLNGLT